MCLFSPSLHPTPAESPLPHLHPPPWFCPCVLYSSSCNPLSSLSPPHSPLGIVRLFLTSMSLVIFCFLFSSIYYIPVKGEIIWYLSLTAWLTSLSLTLSSPIHAVAKGYKLLLSRYYVELHCVGGRRWWRNRWKHSPLPLNTSETPSWSEEQSEQTTVFQHIWRSETKDREHGESQAELCEQPGACLDHGGLNRKNFSKRKRK